MYLADRDIEKSVKNGEITISDFARERLQPSSYDILLGNSFIQTVGHTTEFIDPVNKIYADTEERIVADGEPYILHPGVSILGTSKDFFGSDKYLIQLSGKSSLARIGLLVHNTAGLINPGHFLHITLELCNLNKVPIVLRPGMPIAQLLFSEMSTKPEIDYKKVGRFHGDNWKNNFALPKQDIKVKGTTSKKKVVSRKSRGTKKIKK